MDSFPSYLLVISKIPKRNQKKPENMAQDGSFEAENNEVMFRILSLQENKQENSSNLASQQSNDQNSAEAQLIRDPNINNQPESSTPIVKNDVVKGVVPTPVQTEDTQPKRLSQQLSEARTQEKVSLPFGINNDYVMPEIERTSACKSKLTSTSQKSKVTALIEQSSKAFIENKIIQHIGDGNFDSS